MRSRSAASLGLVVGLAVADPAGCGAQRTVTWQAQAMATTAAAQFVGAGLGVGVRQRGRIGAALTASAGSVGGSFGGRFEGVVSFHLDPTRQSGVAPYASGGLAVVAAPQSAGYLLLVLGLETAPHSNRGWFFEVGVGGGLRAAIGIRWRKSPPRR